MATKKAKHTHTKTKKNSVLKQPKKNIAKKTCFLTSLVFGDPFCFDRCIAYYQQ